ncbi:hypothetical protein D3C80_1013410 [compost metagenome]
MRFAGGQFTEVVIFGSAFQAFNEVVALKVVANFPVPGFGFIARKHAADGAGPTLFDQGFLLLADALLQNIFGINLRHRVLTGGQFLANLFNLLADVVFQRQKGFAIIWQSLSQLPFNGGNGAGNIVNQ